jgi:hypothetical protein
MPPLPKLSGKEVVGDQGCVVMSIKHRDCFFEHYYMRSRLRLIWAEIQKSAF